MSGTCFSLSTWLHQLLEDHLKSLPAEDVEEDTVDDRAWDNWLVESDSDTSSEGADWINVKSDGSGNIEINDSETETADGEPGSAGFDRQLSPGRVSLLATTKVSSVHLPV